MASVFTDHVYQRDGKLVSLQTVVEQTLPFSALEPASQALFKQGTPDDYAIVTRATIFHPQGGGQPSDTGTMTAGDVVFDVVLARVDAVDPGRVLHFGHFVSPPGAVPVSLLPGTPLVQAIDAQKRLLYSRLHTAGHVLGSAVRHSVAADVPGFDELKASHSPDSAACEFRGRIEGRWLAPIQETVDAYIAAAMAVQVEWWSEDDFRHHGLERLLPERPPAGAPPGQKLRVVNIVGADVYPCGGTHVDTTDLCGPTRVTKISRSKGTSRVSYGVEA